MITIDLDRIRTGLPNNASVILSKENSAPILEIFINPPLSDEDFEMCINWQREIIGKESISEFYIEEAGRHWYIYLQRVPMEFIRCSDENINSFTKMSLVKNGKIADGNPL